MFVRNKFAGRSASNGARPRVAVISTYDELCGIAGYTRALERQLRPLMDVEVLDLDQYLLRSPHRRVQRLGDQHIREMAKRLREFDCVNIQLEHGTLGRMPNRILKRLSVLCHAAPALSVTFHTILNDDGIPVEEIWRHLRRLDPGAAATAVVESLRARTLSRGVYAMLHKLQQRKPVRIITHTKRDMRLLRDVHRLRNVLHHPLSFVDERRAREIRRTASRDGFPLLHGLPPEAKLIGTFGFLSPYKGFETAVEALRYLPEDHHLLIFGGVHPQTIRRNEPRDPYITRLLRQARIGQTILNSLQESGAATTLAVDASSRGLLERHPQDLSHRIHFMGVLNDEEFMTAMAVCDAVVLPYLEVGQTSSGPIAMAVDMGCRVVAARNAAFLQFAKYHPGRIEFFDIGNFAELARRLSAAPSTASKDRPLGYNTETNAALYLLANSPNQPLTSTAVAA